MYPAPFRYHRPENLESAFALLSRFGEDARVMAGGQSLIPMMKLRMGDVSDVVDIGRLQDLAYIDERDGMLHIGALATHANLADSEYSALVPMLREAASGIADKQVRSMGTIGGGLSTADPSGDWPTVLRILNTTVVLGSSAGERSVGIADFISDAYVTCLRPDEIVTEIRVPVPGPTTSSGYVAFKRAASCFPTVSAGVQITMEGGNCTAAAIVLGCAAQTAVVSAEAEAALVGTAVDDAALQAAADIIVAASEPPPDARGSELFKRNMLKKLVVEAGQRAVARCRGEEVTGGHRYA